MSSAVVSDMSKSELRAYTADSALAWGPRPEPPDHFAALGGYEGCVARFGSAYASHLWDYQRLYLRDLAGDDRWYWWENYYFMLRRATTVAIKL